MRSRSALARAFTGAASSYWLSTFPLVSKELRHWRQRARQIPDPVLRRLALLTQHAERGNYEGAAAYAALVPHAYRACVVRAVVAFQTAYDYVDTLSEQPNDDPVTNGRQLHLALLSALDQSDTQPNYYAHHRTREDNGYIRTLVQACRDALRALPSYVAVEEAARRAAASIVAYQSLNHEETHERPRGLARWGASVTPPGSGLHWWEAAAGGASSLTVFALIAAAAKPRLTSAETMATEEAYSPWISALHVLLDSLTDRAGDMECGHHNLIDHYSSPAEAANRLGWIAARAVRGAEALPDGGRHALIVAAMACFYLSAPSVSTPASFPAAERVLETMGILARPTMAVLKTRRTVSRLPDLAVLQARQAAGRLLASATNHQQLETQVLDFPLARRGSRPQ